MMNILINTIIFIITLLTINKITDNNKIKIKSIKLLFIIISLIISNLITLYIGKTLISILVNITIVTLYKLIIDKYRLKNTINLKNIIIYILIGITISFSLEISIFNFRHYQSLNYKETELKNIIIDENIINDNGTLTVEKTGQYKLEILNINKKINNIYIDIENKIMKYAPLDITIMLTDEADKVYFQNPLITVSEKIEKSKYHKVHTTGKSEKIAFLVNLVNSQQYSINAIKINKTVPFTLSGTRIILITFLIVLYFLFRSKSSIYKSELLNNKNKNLAIILLVTIEIIGCSIIFLTNTLYMNEDISHHHQYQELAKSFAKGQTHLDIPVPKEIIELENPYDSFLREEHGLIINEDYLWDTAYYNGKYYVYFGVVPVVTSYLPYYMITGKDLQNHHLVYVLGFLTIISFIYLIYQIIKRWFPKTSMGMFLLVSILLINSSGLLILYKCHDIYCVPIIYSIFLTTLGLGLWISSYNKTNKNHNITKLCLGSFCMALVAGCRPQFLISSLLIIPIFIKYFLEEKKITKRKLKELCALLLPYIIVAIPLMIYNYCRFGSIFDFGATYNLTTNDMRKRNFTLEKIFPGLYYMLLAIPKISPLFPFLNIQEVETTYLGKTIFEPILGGFLVSNFICLITLFLPKLKKQFKEKNIYYIALISLISAFIVVIADIHISGILNRYICDFGWLFILPTIIILLNMEQRNNKKELFHKIIILLIFLSVLYSVGNALLDDTYALNFIAPLLYEQIKYIFCFWL